MHKYVQKFGESELQLFTVRFVSLKRYVIKLRFVGLKMYEIKVRFVCINMYKKINFGIRSSCHKDRYTSSDVAVIPYKMYCFC